MTDGARASGGYWPHRTDGGFPGRDRPDDGATNDDARLADRSSDDARRNAAWQGDYTRQDYPPSDHGWYDAARHDDDARQDDSSSDHAWQDDPWQADAWRGDDAWDDGSSSEDAWQDDEAESDEAEDGDGEGDDGDAGPYPLTYERDDFVASAPGLAVGPARAPAGPWETWPAAPDADAATVAGATPHRPATGDGLPDGVPAGWDSVAPGSAGLGGGRRGGRRWPLLAGIVVAGAAVGAATVLLAGPGAQAGRGDGGRAAPAATRATPGGTARASTAGTPPAAAAPITRAQAQAIVARYTTVNNSANAQRSDALLGTVETGSSFAIDAGLYQAQQGAPYPAFGPARTDYYIPRGEPATGPRWFVVQVANAFSADPGKVTSNEYLLFTQASPGGPWLDAAEPYLLPGGNAPRITLGTDGLATALSPDAASVAVPPGQLPAATAAAVNGTTTGSGKAAVTVPGNLADVSDQRFWQGKLANATVTDTHSPAAGTAGQEFALRTDDGGALVFYTDAARVAISPPAGGSLHLSVPGFFSPGQALPQATVNYLEQFAAYDPPARANQEPGVVADYSAITGVS